VDLAVLLVAVAACGSNTVTPQERLIGEWTYTNSAGNAGVVITFKTDDTYSAQVMQLTSTTSANDEVETGVFSVTDTTITFTPQQYTCPGPDPIYTYKYAFNGDSLSMLIPSGAVAFTRYTGPAASNAVITFGCIQSDGSFVQSQLAPVTN